MFFIIWHLIVYLGEKRGFPGEVSKTADTSVSSLWLESSEQHLPISIAGVLRLRAISRSYRRVLRGASLRMTDLWGG
jgi:hypothetical protein